MSYAEHGSRVFRTGGSDDTSEVSRIQDSIVPRKRSEGRLKLFDSCTDPRAWSPNPIDNSRYLKEIVENPLPHGKIVPHDVVTETLIKLGTQTRKELDSLRRQLETYKSLRLSTEQLKQLRDIDSVSPEKTTTNNERSDAPRNIKSTDEKTPDQEITESPEHTIASNHESKDIRRSNIDSHLEAKKIVASPRNDRDESRDLSFRENSLRASQNHREIIIEKDSEIIALENELGAKNVELEDLKESNRILETKLEKNEAILESSRRQFKITQQEISLSNDRMKREIQEWREKLHDSARSIDHLRASLTEKSLEIEKLHKHIEDYKMLKQERDCLVRTRDDMTKERNRLLDVNREHSQNLANQEEEIKHLLSLLKLKATEHEDRESKLVRMIEKLENDLQTRDNSSLANDERVASLRNLEDCPSFGEMTNLELRKMRCGLREELAELDNEMRRRCAKVPDKHHHPHHPRAENETCCDKGLDEYSNEQLKIVQVSMGPPRTTNEQEKSNDEICERDASRNPDLAETIQRLIVQLTPHGRQSLLDLINRNTSRLNGSDVEHRGCLCPDRRDRVGGQKDMAGIINETNEPVDNKESEEKARLDIAGDEKLLDEKIDNALVIHVERSIERVERISQQLEGAGDSFNRKEEELREELREKNGEIAKLQIEVASRIVSRGQGDDADRHENSNELGRLKRELELRNMQLESKDLKLKGANAKIINQGEEINRLTKEHKGLNNTVLVINDLQIKVDEMDQKLTCLQNENCTLTRQVSEAKERCAKYQKKLLEYNDSEMRLRESLERSQLSLESIARDEDTKKEESLRADSETESRRALEVQVAKLTKQIRSPRSKNDVLTRLDSLLKGIQTLGKDSLRVKLELLKSQLDKERRANDNIERDLNSVNGENESLKRLTKRLLENSERNKTSDSRMSEASAKQVLDTLPNKVLGHIEALKSQASSTELANFATLQSELDELRAKSLGENASIIENLRRDIDSWNKKAVEREKRISILEEANTELRRRNEEILRVNETAEQVSLTAAGTLSKEMILKVDSLKAVIAEKDARIEKLTREIESTKEECKALTDKVDILTKEKTELVEKVTKEKKTCEQKIAGFQQQCIQRVRTLHDEHNVSVKRLKAQYEEDMKNNGNSFEPETWLQSLTIKELAELQKRISTFTPARDGSKTKRALNDKQNQQLREDQDETILHYNVRDNQKNGYYKATPSSYTRPAYEYIIRNDFLKPTETSNTDNFDDMQLMNFIHECAKEHISSDANN